MPDFWNTYLQNCNADAMCYLNDDIILYEDTIPYIVSQYTYKFPTFDGVMGLNQINIKDSRKVEAAFGVIGMKYADRFPNRQVFCPDYNRFHADWELCEYAKSIDKFFYASLAQIQHLHPCIDNKYRDATHSVVRKWLQIDKTIFAKRQSKSLLWGRDFTLIEKE